MDKQLPEPRLMPSPSFNTHKPGVICGAYQPHTHMADGSIAIEGYVDHLMDFMHVDRASFDVYQRDSRSTAGLLDRNDPLTLSTLGLGIAGEAGEVADHLKKIIGHGHPLDAQAVDKITLELGDVLWYVAVLASVLDVPLSMVASANRAKLTARYPAGFDAERSRNRGNE